MKEEIVSAAASTSNNEHFWMPAGLSACIDDSYLQKSTNESTNNRHQSDLTDRCSSRFPRTSVAIATAAI
jgi:hypothetical protein